VRLRFARESIEMTRSAVIRFSGAGPTAAALLRIVLEALQSLSPPLVTFLPSLSLSLDISQWFIMCSHRVLSTEPGALIANNDGGSMSISYLIFRERFSQ